MRKLEEAGVFAQSVKDLPRTDFDGLLGMAFPVLATTNGSTFLYGLARDGTYTHLAFGLRMHMADQMIARARMLRVATLQL